MSKKFYLLFGVAFVALGGVCAFGQGKDPNAAEVLRHYRESLSYLQSVSMKIDVERKAEGYDPNSGSGRRKAHYIFRRDRGRTEWIGQSLSLDHRGDVDPIGSRGIQIIMTEQYYLHMSAPHKGMPFRAWIAKDYEVDQKLLLDSPEYGGALAGRIYGNSHKSVAELLGESTNLYMRKEQENINGVPCYALEATSEHGKVTAWVAPEKGYNALRWSIHKTGDDLFDERRIVSKSWLAVFDSAEVREVNDVFVTTGGSLTLTIDFPNGREDVSCSKYKVSSIQLNPDFEALGAFEINLPDGTPVHIKEYPGVRYIWQNGNIVAADDPTFEEIDKMVEELKKEQQ